MRLRRDSPKKSPVLSQIAPSCTSRPSVKPSASRWISFSTRKFNASGMGQLGTARAWTDDSRSNRPDSEARMLKATIAPCAQKQMSENSVTQQRDFGDQLASGPVAHPHPDLLAFMQFADLAAPQRLHMDEDVRRAGPAGDKAV